MRMALIKKSKDGQQTWKEGDMTLNYKTVTTVSKMPEIQGNDVKK